MENVPSPRAGIDEILCGYCNMKAVDAYKSEVPVPTTSRVTSALTVMIQQCEHIYCADCVDKDRKKMSTISKGHICPVCRCKLIRVSPVAKQSNKRSAEVLDSASEENNEETTSYKKVKENRPVRKSAVRRSFWTSTFFANMFKYRMQYTFILVTGFMMRMSKSMRISQVENTR